LFVHWRLPVEQIEPLIPRSLTLDVFDGAAWVGLVPFTMEGVRPWWSPAVRGISAFHETNVRTYVHYRGREPGVWFFSLDAANSLAVRLARWRWRLPYFRAEMSLERTASRVSYASRRLWPGRPGASTSIAAEIGDRLVAGSGAPPGQAVAGTLEHFLAERYVLYAQAPKSEVLLRGRVHHLPYPLRTARLLKLEESLLAAAGISRPGEPDHVLFSEGVDVEVFALQRVVSTAAG
jgi:uncharacterized protein YqjF (DUF2071 family)